MKPILALYIFRYLATHKGGAGWNGVKLSPLRKDLGVSSQVFYKHVNALLDADLIVKYGRDKYCVSHRIAVSIMQDRKRFLEDNIPF